MGSSSRQESSALAFDFLSYFSTMSEDTDDTGYRERKKRRSSSARSRSHHHRSSGDHHHHHRSHTSGDRSHRHHHHRSDRSTRSKSSRRGSRRSAAAAADDDDHHDPRRSRSSRSLSRRQYDDDNDDHQYYHHSDDEEEQHDVHQEEAPPPVYDDDHDHAYDDLGEQNSNRRRSSSSRHPSTRSSRGGGGVGNSSSSRRGSKSSSSATSRRKRSSSRRHHRDQGTMTTQRDDEDVIVPSSDDRSPTDETNYARYEDDDHHHDTVGDEEEVVHKRSGGRRILGADDADAIYIVKQDYGYCSMLFSLLQTVILGLMMWQCHIAPLQINPMIGPYPDALSEWGGKNSILILEDNEWYRLITPILLHAGIIHLAGNIMVQLETGIFFEQEWGSMRWLIIYISSAIGSSILSVIVMPDAVSVGSSGAVMGLFGGKAAEVLLRVCEGKNTQQERIGHEVRNEQCFAVTCGVIIVMLFSFIPYVDWAAHMGGVITGFFVGFICFSIDAPGLLCKLIAIMIGMTTTVIGFTTALDYMYNSGNVQAIDELRDVCGYYQQAFEDYECNCMRDEYLNSNNGNGNNNGNNDSKDGNDKD